jgi:hypothetical protein
MGGTSTNSNNENVSKRRDVVLRDLGKFKILNTGKIINNFKGD